MSSKSDTIIGIDVGGTNTDVILVNGTEQYTHKLPTEDNVARSTAKGLIEIADQHDISPESVDNILHGTTVATNALIELEGPDTGLITTEGMRDITHIGRARRHQTFSVQTPQPQQKHPVVKRRHRKEVTERIYPPGDVVRPLDEEEVIEATDELVEEGIESIAVCYLHSYLDTSHEDRTKELIKNKYPDVQVSTSNEVVNQFREYERFTTTAINARLMPVVSDYLDDLVDRATDAGFTNSEFHIMQSNGGLASLERVSEKPITTLLSGPSSGVLSGQDIGREAGEEKLITFDMGGTSADISVVPGELLEREPSESETADYPTVTPMLDIDPVGSGGGSIAWFDDAKGFHVGPKSAGAEPGPACYGRGGDQPTVTDAQVVLGRIDPSAFLGGDLDIGTDISEKVIKSEIVDGVDQERFSTPERAALSILEVANTKMAQSIRENTVQSGYDPRDYTLVPFGGAGPMHATDLAEEMGISKIIVSPSPGIASARGLLIGDVKYDYQVTISKPLADVDEDLVADEFAKLRERGERQLEEDNIDVETDAEFHYSIDCLYQGQGWELNVEFDSFDGDWRDRVRNRFGKKHESEYGHQFEDTPVELLNLRVTATSESVEYENPTIGTDTTDPSDAKIEESEVLFGTSDAPDRRTVPRYRRSELLAGNVIQGPAIVNQSDSTVVINPGWRAEVLDSGSIELTYQEDSQ
jgi:N-methylhydantoinase A